MQIKKLLLITACSILFSCDGQNNKKQTSTTEKKDMIAQNFVEQVLIKQLKQGYSQSNDITDVKYVEFDAQSIRASTYLAEEILKKNEYIVTETEFQRKVQRIFGDLKYKEDVAMIDKTNLCLKENKIKLNNPEGFRNIVIVDRQGKLILDQLTVPELINYKSSYPQIARLEDSFPTFYEIAGQKVLVNKWKDLQNLTIEVSRNQNKLINRNFYLFKDDSSRWDWLKANDADFLMNLVLKYGYLEDEKLLSFAIERVMAGSDIRQFSQIFWNRNCHKYEKTNSKTYLLLEKKIKNGKINVVDLLERISLLFDYLVNEDESMFEGLSSAEKTKALSSLAYFAEQFKYKNPALNIRIMGKLRYYLTAAEKKTLINNQYFSMPQFEMWWENAVSDEIFVKECIYGGTCGEDNEQP